MDPPRHDRLKALFQRGFTPKRIAEHERADQGDRQPGDRPGRRAAASATWSTTSPGPVVARVIGSFIGHPGGGRPRHMEQTNMALGFGDEDLRPSEEAMAEMMTRSSGTRRWRSIADRRATRSDDLISVLVHAEVDGEQLTDTEIFMGIGLLGAAGNDSTRAVFTSGMLGLMRAPGPDAAPARRSVARSPARSRSCCACTRRSPTSVAPRTREVELHGKTIREGDKVLLWYVSGNRDEAVYEDPQRLDVTRDPDHQAFGAGGRHFCLGAALARLELRILLEETLRRFRTSSSPASRPGALAVPQSAEDASGALHADAT